MTAAVPNPPTQYQAEVAHARKTARTLRRVARAVIVVAVAIIVTATVAWLRKEFSGALTLLIVLFALLGGLLAGDRALASATSLELAASRLELQISGDRHEGDINN